MRANSHWLPRCAAVSLVAFGASAASADPLHFALSGAYTASWNLDSAPAPDSSDIDIGFDVYDVAGVFPGTAISVVDIKFFDAVYGGGLEMVDYNNDNQIVISTVGPQLFTGTEANPVFRTGNFAMSDYRGSGTYSLTISNVVAAVPEPATGAMMLAGIGIMGTVMRRRRVERIRATRFRWPAPSTAWQIIRRCT